MDSRIALEKGTVLELDGINYYIVNEQARGASCIVYNAYYIDNAKTKKKVLLKECYPFKDSIQRLADNSLISSNENVFSACKEEFKRAYILGSEFLNTNGLTNFISNNLNVYEINNTLYTVNLCSEGKTLDKYTPSNIKEVMLIAKNIATTINKLHSNGYLYLDIKPSNLFLLEEINSIQLFDFDSIISITEKDNLLNLNKKISYTKGFAPIEQKMGQVKKIGYSSDIYSLGALVYYLLFKKVPNSIDYVEDFILETDNIVVDTSQYKEILFKKIRLFFQKTLTTYYADRYQTMEEVQMLLDEILTYSDICVPYIYDSKIFISEKIIGRDEEISRLCQWYDCSTKHLFIHGMGGIGKSSVVRKFICDNRNKIDNLIYLNFEKDIINTIIDDSQFYINTILKDDKESEEEYFYRKLKISNNIIRNTKSLLVIDNFDGEITDQVINLLNSSWKIIFISRKEYTIDYCEHLHVDSLGETFAYSIFINNIEKNYTIKKEEYDLVFNIIRKVNYHTLVVELISKQINASHLSIEEASILIDSYGFTTFGSERVRYSKDYKIQQDSIKNIVMNLFDISDISKEKKKILRVLVLFNDYGIELKLFKEISGIENFDIINILCDEGWININNKNIVIHPVIREAVSSFTWDVESKNFILKIFNYLSVNMKIEGDRNNFPKKMFQKYNAIKNKGSAKYLLFRYGGFDDQVNETFSMRLCDGGILSECLPLPTQDVSTIIKKGRLEDNSNSLYTNFEKLKGWIDCSKQFFISRDKIGDLCKYNQFVEMIYILFSNISEDDTIMAVELGEFLLRTKYSNPIPLSLVYSKIIDIYLTLKQIDIVNNKLKSFEMLSNKVPYYKYFVKGIYYNCMSGYYDYLLDGDYCLSNEENKIIYKKFIESINNSIKYMSKSNAATKELELIKYLVLKATVLSRTYNVKYSKEINDCLNKAIKLSEDYSMPYSESVYDLKLACAWYYVCIKPMYGMAIKYLDEAEKIIKITANSDIDYIVFLKIKANIMFEFAINLVGDRDLDISNKTVSNYITSAINLLNECINICEKNIDVEIYVNEKDEINKCLLDVYNFIDEIS